MNPRIVITRDGQAMHCEVRRYGMRTLAFSAAVHPRGEGHVHGEAYLSASHTISLPLARAALAQLLEPLTFRTPRQRAHVLRPWTAAPAATPTGTLGVHDDAEAHH